MNDRHGISNGADRTRLTGRLHFLRARTALQHADFIAVVARTNAMRGIWSCLFLAHVIRRFASE